MTYNKKVIPSSHIAPPSKWSYFDFVSLNDANPIDDWYKGLPEDVQYEFDALLKSNQKTNHPMEWVGFRKFLKGGDLQKNGVWELEFKGSDGLARRLLGIFDGSKRAVFLLGCHHKGRNYAPFDALETAAKRAGMYFRKEAKARERKVKDNI